MPELPEVETIARGLKSKVLNRTFVDVWTDWAKIIKRPKDFSSFKKEIKGRKIEKIRRKGKNIIFRLSGGKALLIHQKLTGHLLFGTWKHKNGKWRPLTPGPLEDPMNRFLHLIFWLDNGKQLALSDSRKFAKVEIGDAKEIEGSESIKNLGPDPLSKTLTFKRFKGLFQNPLFPRRKKGKIKQVLMNQAVVSGIGNIYSDEILFKAGIHPFKDVARLKREDLKKIYQAMRIILKKAIDLRGESISDFRDLEGRRGNFGKIRKVYRKAGDNCSRCGEEIKRIKIGGRSAHFCPKCQKL